jgi:hypothetical protein
VAMLAISNRIRSRCGVWRPIVLRSSCIGPGSGGDRVQVAIRTRTNSGAYPCGFARQTNRITGRLCGAAEGLASGRVLFCWRQKGFPGGTNAGQSRYGRPNGERPVVFRSRAVFAAGRILQMETGASAEAPVPKGSGSGYWINNGNGPT